MQQDTLRVGTSKGEFGVDVKIDLPQTLADMATLSKASESFVRQLGKLMITPEDVVAVNYIVGKFTRGYRIDLQEGGARQAVVELLGTKQVKIALADAELMKKVQAAVEAEIKGFDPAAPRARAKKQAPQTVTLEAGKTSYTPEEVAALLANLRGVVVQK